jgi:hypothetical protein
MNKNTLPYIVIVILLCILLLQRYGCGKSNVNIIDTISIKHDTFYIPIHDTTKGKTVTLPSRVDTMWKHDSFYKPSSNCDTLLQQYTNLGNSYFSVNVSKTKFPIKNYGYVTVYDSVSRNRVISAFAIDSLKLPLIHDIYTVVEPPKRQLYIGGQLFTNSSDPVSAIQIGLIYKDKKDRIFTISTIYDGTFSYGAGCYWKIKFK